MKVGVIGAGGVGLPLVTMLSRIGVGTLVVIDPERVEPTNLPRLAEATRLDALMPLRRIKVLEGLADRLSKKKIDLARRVARRANANIDFTGIAENVIEPEAAKALLDCDFLFLAADSHLARMIVNAISYQYLIPAIQLGTRIDVDPADGSVGDIRSNVRLIVPDQGCMRCNRLISGSRLQEESLGSIERERNRYVDQVEAPSVITFNSLISSQAVTDFMLMTGGFLESDAPLDYLRFRPRVRKGEPVVPIPNQVACPDCGTDQSSRRARGDNGDLPLPER
jgi:molybdopterin/thiamine biosynthesis adenylyltransferase